MSRDLHGEWTLRDRRCRICGCTDYSPCLNAHGEGCAWIEADLCSACVDPDELELRVAGAVLADLGNRLLSRTYGAEHHAWALELYRQACWELEVGAPVSAGGAS